MAAQPLSGLPCRLRAWVWQFLAVGYKRECKPVVAVPQTRRLGAVIKDMALMPTTAAAMVFRSTHQQFVIGFGAHRFGQRVVEAGPSGATVEFHAALEQWLKACCAHIGALALFIIEGTGERTFGVLFKQNGVLLWAQHFEPFFTAFFHGKFSLCMGGLVGETRRCECGKQQGLQDGSSVHGHLGGPAAGGSTDFDTPAAFGFPECSQAVAYAFSRLSMPMALAVSNARARKPLPSDSVSLAMRS